MQNNDIEFLSKKRLKFLKYEMTAGKRSQSAELNQKEERAKSALHKAGQVVLEGHIKHCVREGIEHGDPDKTIENFTKAVEHFANMK